MSRKKLKRIRARNNYSKTSGYPDNNKPVLESQRQFQMVKT